MTTEHALERWFARQAERERNAVRLEDALLGGRFARYFAFRLRFFAVRYVAATVVQLVKVLVLHRLLGATGFFAVIALVAVGGLVAGGWWGALEVLRTRVRLLYRFESPTAVGREVARWIVAAVRLATALVAAAIAWIVIRAVASGGVAPVDLAIAAVVARTGVDLPIRAYHAGAFALRRVYRPWGSILALEVLGLGTLLLLVPVLGAWAIGVSELVMALAFGAVAVRYASRTHRLLGIAPHRLVTLDAVLGRRPGARRPRARAGRSVRRLPAPPSLAAIGSILAPGVAGVAMALDSLVVLAVVTTATATGEQWLAVLIAGVSPTVRAGFDWAQLVYFDLKRLDAPLFANLRRRLDRATLILAVVLGVAFAAVAVALALGPLGVAGASVLALPPFLLAASVLGLSQMQAFTEGAYARATLGGAVVFAGLLAMRTLVSAGVDPLAVLAVTAAAAAVLVRLAGRFDLGSGAAPEPLLPTAWLTRLRGEAGPIRVGMARIRAAEAKSAHGAMADPDVLRTWRATQLARRLAGRAGRGGGVTLVAADRVAWFVPDVARPVVTRRTVILESTGRVTELREARAGDGAAAIADLAAWGLFPSTLSRCAAAGGAGTDAEPAAITDADMERAFRATVATGIVFAPDRRASPDLVALPSTDRRLALWDAIRHARLLSTQPARGAWDVTAWCPDGTLRLVFIAPRSAGSRALSSWRRRIRELNLAAASGGALPSRAAAPPLTRGSIVETSTRRSAPPALAASAATEFRRG